MNGTRDFLFRYPRRIHEKRKSNEARSDESSGFSPLSASHLRLAAANHVPKTEGSRVHPGCRTRPGCHTVILSAEAPRSHLLFLFRYDPPLAPEKHATPPISLLGTEIPLPSPNSSASPSAGRAGIAFFRQVSTRAYRPIRGYRRRSPIQQFPFFPIDVGICLFQRRRAIRDARCSPRWRTV